MIALASLLLLAATARAAPSADNASGTGMSFEFKAADGPALIGAPVELEGTARYPERFMLSLPPDEEKMSTFSVTGLRLDPPNTEAGVTTQVVHLTVVPFELGAQTFPSLAWSLRSSDASETLRSPPVKLDVRGPDPKSGNPRDIKEPLQPPMWAVVSFLAVLLATAGLVAYEAWQLLKRKPNGARASGPPKAPHEIALEELQALGALAVPDRQAYERCAEIIRVYLDSRFAIPALLLTTSDLLKMMRQAEIDRPIVGLTRDLLARCDLVKFAKFMPEGPEFRQDIAAAIQIVKATAPKPAPPPAPAPAIGP